MRTAAAFAWEFRRRHRAGLVALAGYFAVLAIIKLLVLEPGGQIVFDENMSFAFAVIVPMGSTVMYFLAVFSFGLDGDLASRQSIYPARMFTLPVTHSALAGWPMFYGMAAMATLWLVTRAFALWPSELEVPLFWPALYGAVVLAWTQALTWMPYGMRGVRVIVTVTWLGLIAFVVLFALELEVTEPMMLALLAPQIPLAYLVARFAVSRARRGDVPDWRVGRIAALRSRPRPPFRSPDEAQRWFEWQRYGRSLPTLVAMVLPFELSLLFVFGDTRAIVFSTLLGVLLTPPFMAAFVAASVSKPNPAGSEPNELTPFIATRPLSSVSLIAAKLRVTVGSTLVTWVMVLAIIPFALMTSGTSSHVVDAWRHTVEVPGPLRITALGALGLSFLIASTWKQLVQSLYIGMSGRAWLAKGNVFVTLSLLTLLVAVLPWALREGAWIHRLWDELPWILAVLACFKLVGAAAVAVRLYDSRLLEDRTFVVGALCWDVTVLVLYGLLLWLVPLQLIPGYVLALVAILTIPLNRVSAAPLALSWNRHR